MVGRGGPEQEPKEGLANILEAPNPGREVGTTRGVRGDRGGHRQVSGP